jgi:hypothetical protein
VVMKSYTLWNRSRVSSVGVATGYGLRAGRPEFDSRLMQTSFIFFTASRPALGPTKPHIQWVPVALSLGVKRSGRETDHSPPYSAKVWNGGSVPPLPIRLHAVMLN